MRIGIYGGVFDPVHLGHLNIARRAHDFAGLDRLYFVPTNIPPHKNLPLETIEHRINMVLLIINQESRFFYLSRFEESERTSFTFETIDKFKSEFPHDEIFYLIGADSLYLIKYWKNYKKFLKHVKLLVAPRPGQEINLDLVEKEISEKVEIITDLNEINISSTDIRNMIKTGDKNLRNFLSDEVYDYIIKNELYSHIR